MSFGRALESDEARSARRRRVGLLILALVLMGLGDLLCTLVYMTTSGMIEANPVARFMVAIGDAPQLIMFKLFTMALSCGALYLARDHRRAEFAAWMCTLVMLALSLHWVLYNGMVSEMTNEMAILALTQGEYEPRWVKLE